MPKRTTTLPPLSRRERQVMDILFRRGQATAAEVMAELPDPPTYSSVRSILKILVEKKQVLHREEGLRYVYVPAADAKQVREEALKHVIRTFFDGSMSETMAAMLRMSDTKLSDSEIEAFQKRIDKARKAGGGDK
ncbi:MAG TPA: BlaI/MecI/CopY family transcriptional regulator [Gemmatimonadaceae bacterium]|nr:BlaI/MecI/CopY family transcriptional regulator [Gemmatimonadaceae bacterium]